MIICFVVRKCSCVQIESECGRSAVRPSKKYGLSLTQETTELLAHEDAI